MGLDKNPIDRPMVEEMLEHPWLKDFSLPQEQEIHCPEISQALFLSRNGHKISQRNLDDIHEALKKLSYFQSINISALP